MESFNAAVLCLLVLVGLQTCLGADSAWSYTGASDGVSKWAQNFPYQCDGQKQSPIDLDSASVRYNSSLQAFKFTGFSDTVGITWVLSNNGHAVQVTYSSGVLLVSGGSLSGQYQVAQFHFHWGSTSTKGSEHTMDTQSYPMEVHIVCFKTTYDSLSTAVTKSDGLAVLGFFFEISSSSNQIIQTIVDKLPQVKYAGNTTAMNPFPLTDMMTGTQAYYRYQGGLTTPTCNEVVTWTVFRDTIKISEAQVNAFRSLMDSHDHKLVDNFRPPQPLNSRSLEASWDDEKFAGGSSVVNSTAGLLGCALLMSLGLML